MGITKDLTGAVFGRLTVIEKVGVNKHGKNMWLCRCSCGNYTKAVSSYLIKGDVKSCGCYRADIDKKRRESGYVHTRLYGIWIAMKKRCYNKNDYKYQYYGGAGIGICDEWRNNFVKFRDWAYSNGYSDKLTIDRIDVKSWYSPENCRWVSMKEQANNRTNNIHIEYNGETYTLAEIAEKLNLPYSKLYHRIVTRSYSLEDAIQELST